MLYLRMLAIQLCAVFVLLVICSFAPGFFFVRHFRWTPLEKLCGSVGLSLICLYASTFAVYDFTGRQQAIFLAAVSGVCLVLGLLAWNHLRRLAAIASVRRVLAGFGFLFFWTFLLLAMIRNYSGAWWSGDWVEHFQRTLFFVHHFPHNTFMHGNYMVPARPPMMNILGAFFLAQTADRFEIFQFVFAFLNLLPFLPCCLMLPALIPGKSRRKVLPLVALFALNPMVMENVTYAWTKLLTAFFVILGCWFYLAGIRKGERGRGRIIMAFTLLAA